ncbi:MAG: hypothetical protein KC620_14370 [Myxococcales bacterium]|nr:hypothetical protein [Myxococcales bacterium]
MPSAPSTRQLWLPLELPAPQRIRRVPAAPPSPDDRQLWLFAPYEQQPLPLAEPLPFEPPIAPRLYRVNTG